MCKKHFPVQKILSCLLALILCFSSVSVFAADTDTSVETLGSSSADEKNEETPPTEKPSAGSGGSSEADEQSNEIEINSGEDLLALANLVNSGNPLVGTTVHIRSDIDLSNISWVPIGKDASNPFSGTFLGHDYEISGLKITDEDQLGGLFGFVADAVVRNVILVSPIAPASTAGLYYFGANSEFTDCVYKTGGSLDITFKPRTFALSRASTSYDGTVEDTWFARGHERRVYEITTANELANFVERVQDGGFAPIEFDGALILINGNFDMTGYKWKPIRLTNYPQGIQLVGNGSILKNVSGATLFANVDEADISGLTIVNANITNVYDDSFAPGSTFSVQYAGLFAGLVSGSTIRDIAIVDSTLTIDTASSGGPAIIAFFAPEVSGSVISNIAIINCSIDDISGQNSTDMAGFIASFYSSTAENIAINGLSIGVDASGAFIKSFFISNSSFSNVQNVALSNITTIPSQNLTILGYGATSLFSNMVIADIPAVTDTIYEDGSIISVSGLIVDLDTQGFIFENPDGMSKVAVAANLFVDSRIDRSANSSNFRKELTTALMASGSWQPDPYGWTPNFRHFPQVSSLQKGAGSAQIYLTAASEVASIAIFPEEASQIITNQNTNGDRATKIILPGTTPSGQVITWSVTGTVPGLVLKKVASKGYWTASSNTNIDGFDLTASVSNGVSGAPLVKHFNNLWVGPSVIKEIIEFREPKANPQGLVPYNTIASFFYDKNVEINTANAGVVTITNLDDPTDVISIKLDGSDDSMYVSQTRVNFKLTLNQDTNYQVDAPAGMVVEQGGSAESDPISGFTFKTSTTLAPVIQVEEISLSYAKENQKPLAIPLSDILNNFAAYDKLNGTPLHHKVTNPTGAQPYVTNNWDKTNPRKSMERAFADQSQFPDGSNTVRYYIEDADALTNAPVGSTRVFILAKNSNGFTASANMFLLVNAEPEWVTKPKAIVHIEYTKDLAVIQRAATQNASAVLNLSSGESVNFPVTATVNMKDYDAARDVRMPRTVQVAVSAGSGAPVNVSVYLDTPIAWDVTPSPYTMTYSTERQVEEAMNVQVKWMKPIELNYEHYENNYRKPGYYHVDVTSEVQYVTNCPDKRCDSHGSHPIDSVDDTIYIIMREPLASETTHFWGELTQSFISTYPEDAAPTQIVEKSPRTYNLPGDVVTDIANNPGSSLKLEYFDQYGWSFYSDALDTSRRLSDRYALQVRQVDDPRLSDQPRSALQLEFEHTGRLPGTVIFRLNADSVGLNTGAGDLGLYRYDKETDSLLLVQVSSTVDGWADFPIVELADTTYVVKATGTGDNPLAEPPLPTYEVAHYFGDANAVPQVSDFTTIHELDNDEYSNWSLQAGANQTPINEETAPNSSGNWFAVVALIALATLGTIFISNKKKEEQSE